MNLLKRIVSYSPYLLILFVVPVFADAQGVGEAIHGGIKIVLWTFVNNIFGTLIAWAGITLDYAVTNTLLDLVLSGEVESEVRLICRGGLCVMYLISLLFSDSSGSALK